MADAHDDRLVVCQEVESRLDTAIWPVMAPVNVAIYQCDQPISCQEAMVQTYRPIEVGQRWGPAWSTAWFHVTGTIPRELCNQSVYLRFSSSTEAMLWQDGMPQQGFDINRDWAKLSDATIAKTELSLYVEAACNAALGTTTFWWDSDETKTQWEESQPGCLRRCALAIRDEQAWALRNRLEFVRLTLETVGHNSPLGKRAATIIDQACQVLLSKGSSLNPKQMTEAEKILSAFGTVNQGNKDVHVIASGHAHIDTAWLWPIRETRRKCLRTFANVLRLMDRPDTSDFRFTATQPQQYQWVMEDAPELFRQIAKRIEEGRWEVSGAMWIEPDCNVPSGEALIRQVLHALRFNTAHFGKEHQPDFLFLPDTFGFPASLPQIMKLAGIDLFITNKLSWSQTTTFPFMTFMWRGIDGTQVLAQQTPGHDYNAKLDPERLLAGQQRARSKAGGRDLPYLQPFGFGDGGGGPTLEMIHRVGLANEMAEMPAVQFGDMRAFAIDLKAQSQSRSSLPLHEGELYLELHRGTLTTHRRLKQANRRAEERLRLAEWLLVMNGQTDRDSTVSLDEAWRLTLLNQFHDILPGSSIASVYHDAHQDHEQVATLTGGVINAQLEKLIDTLVAEDKGQQLAVVNATSHCQQGVAAIGGELVYVPEREPMSISVIDQSVDAPGAAVKTTNRTLENGLLSVAFDDVGQICSLTGPVCSGDLCAAGAPLNQLVLYEDTPEYWEAWDIDESYLEAPRPLTEAPHAFEIEHEHRLQGSLRVERRFGQSSRIVQRYVLDAGSPRLDIETEIHWNESQKLLRALMPAAVQSRWVTCDIQFGHIRRMTQRKSPWQKARFEFCCHRWMDLSQDGLGLALLNNGVYGHSCHQNVMGLSLVRGSNFPDATADRGVHRFTYSLLPHGGDWRVANVDQQAALLNEPLILRRVEGNQPTKQAKKSTAVAVKLDAEDGDPVEVACLKSAEDGDATILRLVETRGRSVQLEVLWQAPVRDVTLVDLCERPLDGTIHHDHASHRTVLSLKPFEIVTLRAH